MRDKKRIVAFVMTVTLSLVVVLLWGKKGEVVVLKDTGSSPKAVPAASDFEKKAHVIELDRSTLDQMASGECKRIELALFDGEVVEVELDQERRQANGKNGAIIYGDVKPENVMVLPDGSVKLLDFGLLGVGPVGEKVIDLEAYHAQTAALLPDLLRIHARRHDQLSSRG